MKTTIDWKETNKSLPEQTITTCKGKNGKEIVNKFDDECLVIYQGKVKRSRYLTEFKRWEFFAENEVPEYWCKIKELELEK